MRSPCLLALTAAAALLLPGTAAAKVGCEEGARPLAGVHLDGLPERPVARRLYTITTVLPYTGAVNPAPYLGAEYCDDPRAAAATDGWFRSAGRGRYTLDLAFPRAGEWKVAFMDLTGTFSDVRMGRVRAPGASAHTWRITSRRWWLPALAASRGER